MRICGIEKNVFFTGIVSFFMDLSSEMVYPLVPLFLTGVLGVTTSVIGLIEGIAESTSSLLKVVSGRLSDRMGNRKIFMIVGYGLAALSRPILAGAGTWHSVLTARFIDRFGKGIRTAPRDALIAASTETPHLGQAFGFHRAMDTAGALCGPAAAFLLLTSFSQNVRTVFWISLLPAVVAVLIIAFYIGETKAEHPLRSPSLQGAARTALDRKVIFFIAIAGFFALGNSSDVFLILKAKHAGISVPLIPVVYLVFNTSYALTAIPSGIAADRFGPD
ncbi:MAG: MFS transporter, partial [Desulfobacterota bacterium]|nr:MFS transporter [Thermodesulfobacteriota bacterium]